MASVRDRPNLNAGHRLLNFDHCRLWAGGYKVGGVFGGLRTESHGDFIVDVAAAGVSDQISMLGELELTGIDSGLGERRFEGCDGRIDCWSDSRRGRRDRDGWHSYDEID